MSEIVQLRAELAELRAGLAEAQEIIGDLLRVSTVKDERISQLMAENSQLKARVAELEQQAGMNSKNSSLPPSSDRMGRTPAKSLREKSGRKPGKAKDEDGSALAFADPDVEHDWYPGACGDCGADLAGAEPVGLIRRQVHEMPEPKIVVTEHRMHKRRCVTAGLSVPWSSGQAEGQNTRVKRIKRDGYGRANFDLLRKRILLRD